MLLESSKWYVLSDGNLGEGVYRMENDSLSDTGEDVVRMGDKIRVEENNLCHDILGIPVYEHTHANRSTRSLLCQRDTKMKTFEEFMKQFDEEITNNTSQVPGAGSDSSTVIVRRKYDRKNKRKDAVAILRRIMPKNS